MTAPSSRAPLAPADTSRLAGGAGASLLGKLGGRGAHFASQIVLARLLGPSGFGLYAIGWALLRMGGLVSPLGLDKGVLVFLSREESREQRGPVLRRALLLSAVSGAVLGGGLFALAPWLSIDVFREARLAPVLRIFAVAFPALACLRVAAEATRVSQKMKYAIRSQDLAQPLANLALILVAYLAGLTLLGYVAAAAASFAAGLGLAVLYAARLFPGLASRGGLRAGVTRELLTYALPVAAATVATKYVLWIDRLFVGFFWTAGDVGVYHTASQTAVVFIVVATGLEAMFAPMIADLHHRGHRRRVAELYTVATKWGLYLSSPLALTIALFSEEILLLAFGPEYGGGSVALTYLTLGGWLAVGASGISNLLLMTRHERLWLAVAASMLGVNLLLNLILVPPLGLTGAAIATATTHGGLFILSLLAGRRSLGLFPFDRRYMKGIAAALATVALLILVRGSLHVAGALRLSIALVAAYGGFLGTLLLLGIDREDRALIRDARDSVRRRLARRSGTEKRGPP